MRRSVYAVGILAIALAFAAGYLLRGGGTGAPAASGGRQVLYWVDPMNPALKSDKPGIAPCGMPLEPVYADGDANGAARASEAALPPGTVEISPDRQQLIGVRVEPASRRMVEHTLRLLGRVAADETRIYRLYSVTDGWIREISSATTGSVVRKDDLLAAYHSQELLGPQQAHIYALDALDRFIRSGTATEEQLALNRNNVANTRQTLLNLGMTERQAAGIAERRKSDPLVQILAPVDGFVLARGVSMGQRFDRTTELYTIADLSHVWILADAFESDAAFVRPGTRARAELPHRRLRFEATVASVPPQFDAASRSLQFRLEAVNPDAALRPGMFVDVDLPIELPPALVVPADAVLDSGVRRTVFVDRGEGFFEPRRVETGWRFGGEVEITSGLMEGERIVVSGNFFVDSESRSRGAAGPPPAAVARDPICGMDVGEASARAQGLTSERGGRTWFFCGPGCKKAFDAGAPGHETAIPAAGPAGGDHD